MAIIQSPTSSESLLTNVDESRTAAYAQLKQRSALGQFFTPPSIAQHMAQLLEQQPEHIKLLDPGAGVGILTAAVATTACQWTSPPKTIEATLYELDATLLPFLQRTLSECKEFCAMHNVDFVATVHNTDFLAAGVEYLQGNMFQSISHADYNIAILNPPYKKIRTNSRLWHSLKTAGISTTNLYAAFIWVAQLLLQQHGQLVAITPRSFCNGPYFQLFRQAFLRDIALRQIHIFDSRSTNFDEGSVLQENIIVYGMKGGTQNDVILTSSFDAQSAVALKQHVPYDQLVAADDPDQFIHLPVAPHARHQSTRLRTLNSTLQDLGLSVSTGRVVDFRAKDYLRSQPEAETVPLIYPIHLQAGQVVWPNNTSRKANAILNAEQTTRLLVPTGWYVLVKRFSAKEEARRVYAALYNPEHIPSAMVGFENHLNYYHAQGCPLEASIAKGLVLYLNSTLVDMYVRQFSGHTQINATDLRKLPYPSKDQLRALDQHFDNELPPQDMLDQYIQQELDV